MSQRIRSVHPGLFTDDAFVSCSSYARLLIIGLWTEADDQGVFPWNPVTLKIRLLPMDNIEIEKLLEELEDQNVIKKYAVDGKSYGAIRNFRTYQHPRYPKYIHPIPDHYRNYVSLTDGLAVKDGVKEDELQRKEAKDGVKEGSLQYKRSSSCSSSKEKLREENINTNPSSKATELPNSNREPGQNSHAPQEKSRVHTNSYNGFIKNPKSYDLKIKQVTNYYNKLTLEEQQRFYSGAKRLHEPGSPIPEDGSMDMNILLIQWYDQTVENQSPCEESRDA